MAERTASVADGGCTPARSLPIIKAMSTFSFSAEVSDLAKAVSAASRFSAGRSSALPILTGVAIDVGDSVSSGGGRVEGTDSESRGLFHFAASDYDDGGRIVLPARLTTDIVKSLPGGKVTFELVDGEVQVTAGRARFTVRPLPADDWPQWSQTFDTWVDVPADKLLDALKRVGVAASDDEARPVLTGVLFEPSPEALRFVATDSYRLAIADVAGASLGLTNPVLVPGGALDELERLKPTGTVHVGIGERAVCFTADEGTVMTRLLEGEFPKYTNLIPTTHNGTLTVDRAALSEVVKRVLAIGRDPSTPIRLTATPADNLSGNVKVERIMAEVGEGLDWIDGDHQTPNGEFMVAFNPQYLLDGLEACRAERCTLAYTDALKPVLLTGVGDTATTYLLMPVRVP